MGIPTQVVLRKDRFSLHRLRRPKRPQTWVDGRTFSMPLDSSGTHFGVAKTSQSSPACHPGRIKAAEPPQRLLDPSQGNPVLDPSLDLSRVLRDASWMLNSFQPYPHILRPPRLYLLWHLGSSTKNYEEVLATILPPESKKVETSQENFCFFTRNSLPLSLLSLYIIYIYNIYIIYIRYISYIIYIYIYIIYNISYIYYIYII